MAKKRSPGPKIDAAPHDLHCPVGNRSSYLRSDALTLHFGCRTFGRADAKEPCTNNLTIEPLWPRRGRPALRGCDDQVIFARLLTSQMWSRVPIPCNSVIVIMVTKTSISPQPNLPGFGSIKVAVCGFITIIIFITF